jgi:molybdenum cofactor cytidylyltransferase
MVMPDRASISGVILAAGSSARLGRAKQLLPLVGVPLLTHVLRNASASQLDEIILVLGHEADRIAAAVGDWGQRLVVSGDYAQGQSASLRAGLLALDPAADAALFLLGDQPRVGPEVIDTLIAAYHAGAGSILVPEYGGQRGNPILFARSLFPELARVTGDEGARGVVRAHASEVVAVPVSDDPPPPDVDTEEDYADLQSTWPASARVQ